MMFSNNIDYWDLKEDSDYILHHYVAVAQSLDFSIEKTQFQLRNCAFCLLFHLLHLFHHRSTFSHLLLQRLSLLN